MRRKRYFKKIGAVSLLIIIFGITVAMSILLIAGSAQKKVTSSFIGEAQLVLLEGVQNSEDMLLYVDQSAKMSFQYSLQKLAEQGGFLDKSECSTFNGYNLWNNATEECWPYDLEYVLVQLFKPKFKGYLEKYPVLNPPDYNVDILYSKDNLNLAASADDSLRIALGSSIMNHLEEIESESAGNEITGKATIPITKEVANRKLAGIYEVRPDTRIKIFDYMGFFEELKSRSQELIAECSAVDEQEKCVKKKVEEYGWSLGCDNTDKDVFYDFVSNLELCFNTNDDDCYCKFMPLNEDVMGKEKLVFNVQKGQRLMSLKYKDEQLTFDMQGKDIRDMIQYDVVLDYSDNDLADISVNGKDSGNVLRLYKSGNNLEYVYRPISMGQCKVNKDKYRICAYDELGSKYKFALTLTDLPPPPIENVIAYDAEEKEDAITVEFDESKANDLKNYVVYYFDTSVNDGFGSLAEMNDKIVGGKIFKKELALDDLSILEEGRLSCTLKDNIFDSHNYKIAVSAIDLKDQQIDNVVQKFDVAEAESIDDLSPKGIKDVEYSLTDAGASFDITLPNLNVDDSVIKEQQLFVEAYVDKSLVCDMDAILSKRIYRKPHNLGKASVSINLDNGNNYCFAFAARDEQDNPEDIRDYAYVVGPVIK